MYPHLRKTTKKKKRGIALDAVLPTPAVTLDFYTNTHTRTLRGHRPDHPILHGKEMEGQTLCLRYPDFSFKLHTKSTNNTQHTHTRNDFQSPTPPALHAPSLS